MAEFILESREEIQRVVDEVARRVSEIAGIQLGEKQKPMVESRLKSRILKLKLNSFAEYLKYLRAHSEVEGQALMSVMTTHHSYFFREFSQFEFLLHSGLDGIIAEVKKRTDKTIRIWSAAASRGQEVYSLAMFFHLHLPHLAKDLKFEIWGTDIDPESIKIATNGVYRCSEVNQSPAIYLKNNWTQGQGEVREFMRVKKHLKESCHFSTFNLLQNEKLFADQKFDIIFCRNVFIYFNAQQIQQATQSLLNELNPHGFLFLGVSESLHGLKLPLDLMGPATYRQNTFQAKAISPSAVTPPVKALPNPIEVLTVDDSPTILAMLNKILIPAEGFQVTGVAKNGREALEILKTKKFHVITLDLHMPELDGLGFLKEYRDLNRIPVVIVSALGRENKDTSQKAFSLGASDYVEKPTLENLTEAGNQIRAKLRTALSVPGKGVVPASPNVKSTKESSVLAKSTGSQLRSLSPFSTSTSSAIKVLIIDDSKTMRALLTQILSKDKTFQVVGQAEKPSEVEALIEKYKPDLITLDLHLPEMDGVSLLRKIYPKYRIPTVVISSISVDEGPFVLQALELGAIDYIQKPEMSRLGESSDLIRERLKAAAAVHNSQRKKWVGQKSKIPFDNIDRSLIVMGASTGGTEALKVVLEGLPSEVPAILIVQHIPAIFSAAFAERLNRFCDFEVREAQHGDVVRPNRVLIAPGGYHMRLVNKDHQRIVEINQEAPIHRHRPSVDYLFRSVPSAWNPTEVVAVLLTGMGSDGALEMKTLQKHGAQTIAQDESSSVIFGMPREAIRLGAANHVLPLDQIAGKIISLVNTGKKLNKIS